MVKYIIAMMIFAMFVKQNGLPIIAINVEIVFVEKRNVA